MGLLITIIIGGAALFAYSIFEKRINQRACDVCGFRMSKEALDDQCPNCGADLGQDDED